MTEQGDEAGDFAEGARAGAEAAAASGDGSGACPEATSDPPAGATVGPIGDLDGDGEADEAWVVTTATEGDQFGVTTSGGVGAAGRTSLPSNAQSVLVADADERSPVEVFVSDGGAAELWGFDGCALRPVADDGGPVVLDLGREGTGTGTGCVDVGDGHRDLVALDVSDDDGTTVVWVRTVIELDGFRARTGDSDGGTFTRGEDDEAIALLHTVSCHELTMEGAVTG